MQQLVEHGQHVGLVVVPPEAESLGRHGYQLCVCYVTSSLLEQRWAPSLEGYSSVLEFVLLLVVLWKKKKGRKKRSISVLLRNFESRPKVGILPRATHSHRENISPLAGDTQFPSKPVPGRTTKTNKRARIHPLVIWQRAL